MGNTIHLLLLLFLLFAAAGDATPPMPEGDPVNSGTAFRVNEMPVSGNPGDAKADNRATAAGSSHSGGTEMRDAAIPEITEISYHYGDASVPPDYHRSYTVTLTAESIRVVVDSYGEIRADKVYSLAPGQFNEMVISFHRNRIRNCRLGDDEGCTGGTSEAIRCSEGENSLFSGTVYHCGGEDTGDLCGNIAAFADDLKTLLPDLDKLLL